jgi:hypothetical protein|tara:strand:- start:73 stop:294 length:222 start_codon:yes stop_codon:yes gene_type:complete
LIFLALRTNKGKKVAMIKDKNNNDWDINGLNISFDNNIPTNKLFEKSGEGNNKNPAINPIMIDIYAVFSSILL